MSNSNASTYVLADGTECQITHYEDLAQKITDQVCALYPTLSVREVQERHNPSVQPVVMEVAGERTIHYYVYEKLLGILYNPEMVPPAGSLMSPRDDVKTPPKFTTDPMQLKTGSFTPLQILYHHQGFVIALGRWDDDYIGVGCRWHAAAGDKVGYPNGFGRPQWMNLPLGVGDIANSDNPLHPEQISLSFRGPTVKNL